MDSAIHDGVECMSVHAVAGLIKFFSPASRVGLSIFPGRDLPGQLDGLLRTSLPGKTVTGQDPASLERLDLFQRSQGPVVILVQEPGEQLRPGLAAGKAERRQRVAHDQDFTVGQARAAFPAVWPGVWMTRGRPGTSRTSSSVSGGRGIRTHDEAQTP